MCSIAEVTTCRPAARWARPLMARLFASVALAVKMTPRRRRGEQARHLGPGSVERRAGLETQRVLGVGIADATLQEGPHQRNDPGVDG